MVDDQKKRSSEILADENRKFCREKGKILEIFQKVKIFFENRGKI